MLELIVVPMDQSEHLQRAPKPEFKDREREREREREPVMLP